MLDVRLKSTISRLVAVLVSVKKLLSPEYTAVIECVATDSEFVVSVAMPEVSGTEPSGVVPSRNVTLPVGVDTVEETVAVSVTAFSTSAEFTLEANETAGVALVMLSVPVPEAAA
jgi:hypothetical protein